MRTNSLAKLAGFTLLAATLSFAQTGKPQPRAGVSVQMVKTRHAAILRAADDLDAVVVAVTEKGNVYVGIERCDPSEAGRKAWAAAAGKLIYLKADARAAGATVQTVLTSLQAAGARELGLLTDQQEPGQPGFPRPPRGLVVALGAPGRVVAPDARLQPGEAVKVPLLGPSVRTWLETVDACLGQGAKVGV